MIIAKLVERVKELLVILSLTENVMVNEISDDYFSVYIENRNFFTIIRNSMIKKRQFGEETVEYRYFANYKDKYVPALNTKNENDILKIVDHWIKKEIEERRLG